MDPKLVAEIKDWLGIIAILIVWTAGVIKAYNANRRAIETVATDVNKVGERANETKSLCATHAAAVADIKLELQRSMDDRAIMREKIATNAKAIEAVTDELRADRLAVMSTLHANEKAASERDAQNREKLARIEERLDIERMVKNVVRSLKE
jgi:septal ring factor EnvC (AmiA/AmiB activator)